MGDLCMLSGVIRRFSHAFWGEAKAAPSAPAAHIFIPTIDMCL